MIGGFQQVEEPGKLVFVGNAIVNGHEVMQHLTAVMVVEENGNTKMTVHIVVTKATPQATGLLRYTFHENRFIAGKLRNPYTTPL